MNPEVTEALIQLAITRGIPLAGDLAEGLIESVLALAKRISVAKATGQHDPLAVACRIVAGIDHDHPAWPTEQKRRWAADAIATYLGMPLGTHRDAAAVNALLELAVQRIKGA